VDVLPLSDGKYKTKETKDEKEKHSLFEDPPGLQDQRHVRKRRGENAEANAE